MNLLLVHGLWRTPLSFLVLVRRLRQWGYSTEQFAYAAVAQPYEVIAARLANRLNRLAAQGPYAVIGHSLGGILLRSALLLNVGPAPSRLIMLGPPNRPPKLARLLGGYWMYQRLMGECGANLASSVFYEQLPPPTVPYTIVAGTAGPRGRWSPFGDEPNDGIVAVTETRIREDDPIVTLPVTHTFMMNNAAVHSVIRQVIDPETGGASR